MSRKRWGEGKRHGRVVDSFTELARSRQPYQIGRTATQAVIQQDHVTALAAHEAAHGIGEKIAPMPRDQRLAAWQLAQRIIASEEAARGFEL